MKKIAILGTVGIPASYGGFETLAQNLVNYAAEESLDVDITVYCSGILEGSPKNFNGASLQYINLDANGVSSIFYDILSLIKATRAGYDLILLLGISGAIFLPFVRLFSNVRIVTNVDGVEWRRDKWGPFASLFLRISEWSAVKYSHDVICDNRGIADHVLIAYEKESHVIAYGGDHAVLGLGAACNNDTVHLPENYCLALCRIEPENNIKLILDAFSETPDQCLVFIGNWDKSGFGRFMRVTYSNFPNIWLLDPIYDLGVLMTIRSGCALYVHGHSAGGTNPSLVEMMHFGKPILAYDCIYNRATTQDQAIFFESANALVKLLELDVETLSVSGDLMVGIARKKYVWSEIGGQYFKLLM